MENDEMTILYDGNADNYLARTTDFRNRAVGIKQKNGIGVLPSAMEIGNNSPYTDVLLSEGDCSLVVRMMKKNAYVVAMRELSIETWLQFRAQGEEDPNYVLFQNSVCFPFTGQYTHIERFSKLHETLFGSASIRNAIVGLAHLSKKHSDTSLHMSSRSNMRNWARWVFTVIILTSEAFRFGPIHDFVTNSIRNGPQQFGPNNLSFIRTWKAKSKLILNESGNEDLEDLRRQVKVALSIDGHDY